jgi:hypothetical protein
LKERFDSYMNKFFLFRAGIPFIDPRAELKERYSSGSV